MRVQYAVSAYFILQRQRLGFELDPIRPGDFWPYVQRRRFLQVRVTELKHDFRISCGETIDVANAPPQDEGVVIKTEVWSVPEDDFPDVRPQTSLRIGDKPNFEILCRTLHELAEIAKAIH